MVIHCSDNGFAIRQGLRGVAKSEHTHTHKAKLNLPYAQQEVNHLDVD